MARINIHKYLTKYDQILSKGEFIMENKKNLENTKNEKPWYEKVHICIDMIAGIFAILGISVLSIINYCIIQQKSDSKQVPEDIIYSNSIWFSVECASVMAKNIDGDYVPIIYSPINTNDTMTCMLVNENEIYVGVKEDNFFKFNNIIPGEYQIEFSNSSNPIYLYDESSISITESTVAKSVIHTKMLESDYSSYQISYNSQRNVFYEFRDQTCSYRIIDDTFLTDEDGTFYFLVDWNAKNVDVKIHSINGAHLDVLMNEQYNGARFIN